MKKHVRGEDQKAVDDLVALKLLTPTETFDLTTRLYTCEPSNLKSNHFPSTCRYSLVMQMMLRSVAVQDHKGKFKFIQHMMDICQSIKDFEREFETLETIGSTVMPFPYAQAVKGLLVFYLAALPFGNVALLGRLT